MDTQNIQLAWSQPKSGNGPRVLELWADGRRVCGIADCDDNAALERIVQQANEYEDCEELKEEIADLNKTNADLNDRIEELEEEV